MLYYDQAPKYHQPTSRHSDGAGKSRTRLLGSYKGNNFLVTCAFTRVSSHVSINVKSFEWQYSAKSTTWITTQPHVYSTMWAPVAAIVHSYNHHIHHYFHQGLRFSPSLSQNHHQMCSNTIIRRLRGNAQALNNSAQLWAINYDVINKMFTLKHQFVDTHRWHYSPPGEYMVYLL